ncbi:hypothetical protein ACFZBU_27465 [Embleya sp. NPDC008237]|uniref:hypothetical protein n=1 Tax=Embleya sp. NPDC008237 TaxID=3363978 RepID=UPI0036E74081
MTEPQDELTPWERALLGDPGSSRGYQPNGVTDDQDEPAAPPAGPAGASAPGPTTRQAGPNEPGPVSA